MMLPDGPTQPPIPYGSVRDITTYHTVDCEWDVPATKANQSLTDSHNFRRSSQPLQL